MEKIIDYRFNEMVEVDTTTAEWFQSIANDYTEVEYKSLVDEFLKLNSYEK